MLQSVRELKASVEESHSEWMKVKWRDIVNIVSLKVLSELHLEQVVYLCVLKYFMCISLIYKYYVYLCIHILSCILQIMYFKMSVVYLVGFK